MGTGLDTGAEKDKTIIVRREIYMATQMNSLQSLFFDELKDIYHAEKQLVDALPKMAEAANSPDLKRGLTDHLHVTRSQMDRLEQIFNKHGERPTGKVCVGMMGIIDEGQRLIKNNRVDPDVKDAGLILAAQKAEHYEIAAYGTLATYADQLGFTEESALLKKTLDEEEKTDQKLTQMAESHINVEAKS